MNTFVKDHRACKITVKISRVNTNSRLYTYYLITFEEMCRNFSKKEIKTVKSSQNVTHNTLFMLETFLNIASPMTSDHAITSIIFLRFLCSFFNPQPQKKPLYAPILIMYSIS